MEAQLANSVFHKVANTGNKGKSRITGFIMWKQKKPIQQQNVTLVSIEPGSRHLDLMLSSLSYWGMCYLRDLRSPYGHSLSVLTKWSKSKIEVV